MEFLLDDVLNGEFVQSLLHIVVAVHLESSLIKIGGTYETITV